MINFFAKALVLFHTILSLAAMTWAIMVVLQVKDFGWLNPYVEVLDYDKEGKPKTSVRHASTYDKSVASLAESARTRDLAYSYVKPASDSLRNAEQYLPGNHLYYQSELKRLHEETKPIAVKRLQNTGVVIEPNTRDLGKPVMEEDALKDITKSNKSYQGDLKKLIGHKDMTTGKVTLGELDIVEDEIRKIVNETKKITAELTGTDEFNKYVQPGLYQLIDLEFKAQRQIKAETDNVKPNWAKAINDSQLYRLRRADLENSLEKLRPLAPAPKVEKK